MDPLTSDVEAELSEHSISYSVSDKEDLIAAESSDVQLIPPSKGVGIRSILAGVEESEYSLAVGEEKSSTAAQDQTVENAREISLGSYSESMNSSEAGLSLIRAYQSQQASLSRGSTAFQGNTSNSASFSEHLQLHAHVQEGSYFTLASESGSLTESRKHAKSREVDKSNLPYWYAYIDFYFIFFVLTSIYCLCFRWSSLSKPSL